MDAGVAHKRDQWRLELGLRGLVVLTRKLQAVDPLSEADSVNIVIEHGSLSRDDARVLFRHLDHDHRRSVPADRVIQFLLGGSMPAKRLYLVRSAFNSFDKGSGAAIAFADIARRYNASDHPDVLGGRRSKEDVLKEFLDTMEVGDAANGLITREDFERYHQLLSATLPHREQDEEFSNIVQSVWHLRSPAQQKLQLSCATADIAASPLRPAAAMQSPQSVPAACHAATRHGKGDRRHYMGPADRPWCATFSSAPALLPGSGFARCRPSQRPAAFNDHLSLRQLPVGIQVLLDKVTAQLTSKGLKAFVDLARHLCGIEHGSVRSGLTLAMFRKALAETGLTLDPTDVKTLYSYFDVEGTISIDPEELLRALCGQLKGRQRQVVEKAFGQIDTDCDGVVLATQLVQAYDASRHPHVIEGVRTEEEVRKELLDTLEVRADGTCTREEFVRYYTLVNASLSAKQLSGDDYFELLVRSVWRLPGGDVSRTLPGAETVVAIHRDGRRTVEKVDDASRGITKANRLHLLKLLQGERVDVVDLEIRDDRNAHTAETSLIHGPHRLATALRLCKKHCGKGKTEPAGRIAEPSADCTASANMKHALRTCTTPSSSPSRSSKRRLPDPGVQNVVDQMRLQLTFRGLRTLEDLFNNSRGVCGDSHAFSLASFKRWLRSCGVHVADRDIDRVFLYCATDEDGLCDMSELFSRLLTSHDRASSTDDAMHAAAAPSDGATAPAAAPARGYVQGGKPRQDYRDQSSHIDLTDVQAHRDGGGAKWTRKGLIAAQGQPSQIGNLLAVDDLTVIPPVSVRGRGTQDQVGDLTDMIRSTLAERGIRGVSALVNRLRSWGDKDTRQMPSNVFFEALTAGGIRICQEDKDLIATTQGTGDNILYEEFIKQLQGNLSDTCREVVKLAFAKLDQDKTGVVDVERVAGQFDAAKHPDVLSGKRDAQDVTREFLETFSVGGEVPCCCTQAEFLDYYRCVSASYPSREQDDYFERMVRNVWHLSGSSDAGASLRACHNNYASKLDAASAAEVTAMYNDVTRLAARLKQRGAAGQVSLAWAPERSTQPTRATSNRLRNPTYRSTFIIA